ncbi:MAG: GNAT family N-acetyltransferase [Actinobacteria bacterium]|nr:GNAT family N-acetyltransferase [Actinomycetota bacterium]
MNGPVLRTERLVLRRWRDDDLEPFAALNADPEVMRHFPASSVLDRAGSDAMVGRIEAAFDELGYGLWAVEVLGGDPPGDGGPSGFIGFVGLAVPRFQAHFTPAVEVGWRLARAAWGRGYAPEAAREALRFAFEEAGLREVVSFTTAGNAPSRRVMHKIGMAHDPADDFDHPGFPDWEGRRHVLYRITADGWRAP